VVDGYSGLLVPAEDVEALARAIERLVADPAEAARMGANGRALLEERSSWKAVAERVSSIYAELVAARQRPGR